MVITLLIIEYIQHFTIIMLLWIAAFPQQTYIQWTEVFDQKRVLSFCCLSG
jgi:hypothetical protein